MTPAALWTWVATVGLAFGLALYTWRLDTQKKIIVGILSIVVACFGATVALYFEVISIRFDQAAALSHVVPTLKSPIWNAVVQDIAEYDRRNTANEFEQILSEPLRQEIANSFNQAKDGRFLIFDRNEVVLATLKMVAKAKQSVRATSYIDPKEWWVSSIAPEYEAGLKTAKKGVGTIQRVFIVDSTEEALSLRSLMVSQQNEGVEVKYICATSISPDRREDFIIIDSSVAGELILDSQRKFKGAQFFPTTERAADFENRFNNLWIAATPVSRIGLVACGSNVTK